VEFRSINIASGLLCWSAYSDACGALHINPDELQVSHAKLAQTQPCRLIISSIALPEQIRNWAEMHKALTTPDFF
jgi:hypothetical protein